MLKNWKFQWLSVGKTLRLKKSNNPSTTRPQTYCRLYHQGTMKHVDEAIKAALAAKNNGTTLDGSKEQRSSLKAADLIA